MEVHAHSHTERKKWTHYLWEFLMLFLAVTLGFLVENQREHYVEHQREKQFIQSLFNDIKSDTTNIVKIINARTAKERMIDSMIYMMNSSDPGGFIRLIYPYAILVGRTLPYRFIPNDGTMQQLKNSGALRLIRNRIVVDSIAKYDINVRNILGQYSVEENQIEHYRTAAAKIFDALVFDSMIDENATVVNPPPDNASFQPFTKRELSEWNYRIYGLNGINKANRRDLRLLLKQAAELLDLLKKEYHIE
ncbi:MAG TPA: hypothetical protein VHQ93_10290 [Chitinophagaceae bacterium]|jgi:hypothetical protein|nr:hypothetical protein [Chitinophagaceae bacterium]